MRVRALPPARRVGPDPRVAAPSPPPANAPAAPPAQLPRTAARQSRDFYKPQYIDFESPLLVQLFGRISGKLSNYTVTLEEQFPAPDALPTFGGEHFTSELILQLDVPADDSEAAAACIAESSLEVAHA